MCHWYVTMVGKKDRWLANPVNPQPLQRYCFKVMQTLLPYNCSTFSAHRECMTFAPATTAPVTNADVKPNPNPNPNRNPYTTLNQKPYNMSCRGRAVRASDFHTGGPRFEPRPGSSALGQGALSSLPSLSSETLTLIRLGGGHDGPPLDISRDYSATREALAATLYDNSLSSLPHILTPNLWRPGVRFRSYVTLFTCTSDRKWLQNVILCTKSMQIEFSHLVHINMHIFTLNCWN